MAAVPGKADTDLVEARTLALPSKLAHYPKLRHPCCRQGPQDSSARMLEVGGRLRSRFSDITRQRADKCSRSAPLRFRCRAALDRGRHNLVRRARAREAMRRRDPSAAAGPHLHHMKFPARYEAPDSR